MGLSKDEEIIARGCEPAKEIIIPDDDLMELINYLAKLPIFQKKWQVHRMRLKDILYDGRTFIDEHFKLHKIPHINVIEVPLINRDIVTIRNIHPYKLPLQYVEEVSQGGYVQEIFPPDRSRVLFKSLAIGEEITELSSSSYVHEITHTQLNSIKGSIKDYFNQEVFSIFLEFIHASEISKDDDIIRIEEANRIYELSEIAKQQIEYASGRLDLPREEQIENSKYIQSDLIAFKLFSIYYFSHYTIQREMLKKVQDVFDGKMTVEEYLAYYDISFENSQNKSDIQKYLYRIK